MAIPSTLTGTVAALTRDWLARFINRNLGSTALHLALVAGAELDAMLADNSRLWDIAAGWLLVTLAGGQVTTPTGEALFPLDVQAYTDQELPIIAIGAAARARVPHPSGVGD